MMHMCMFPLITAILHSGLYVVWFEIQCVCINVQCVYVCP